MDINDSVLLPTQFDIIIDRKCYGFVEKTDFCKSNWLAVFDKPSEIMYIKRMRENSMNFVYDCFYGESIRDAVMNAFEFFRSEGEFPEGFYLDIKSKLFKKA